MKILIIGRDSLIGHSLCFYLKHTQNEVLATSHDELDIVNRDSVVSKFYKFYPDIVFLCAAFTDVDNAEHAIEECVRTNIYGVENVVFAANTIDAKLVYFSTNYVFDGLSTKPYNIFDKRKPLNIYGLSKMIGEMIISDRMVSYFIIRTSWVYGNKNDFVSKILSLSESSQTISVVDDQISSPTYVDDLTNAVIHISKSNKFGIYHITNQGCCSKYQFAKKILEIKQRKTNVQPVKSYKFIESAPRPQTSCLSSESLIKNGFELLPNWIESLQKYLLKNDK